MQCYFVLLVCSVNIRLNFVFVGNCLSLFDAKAHGGWDVMFKLIHSIYGSNAATKNNIKRKETKSRLNEMYKWSCCAGGTFNKPRVKEETFSRRAQKDKRLGTGSKRQQTNRKTPASSNEERCRGKDKQG
jgi:hypothetical protein